MKTTTKISMLRRQLWKWRDSDRGMFCCPCCIGEHGLPFLSQFLCFYSHLVSFADILVLVLFSLSTNSCLLQQYIPYQLCQLSQLGNSHDCKTKEMNYQDVVGKCDLNQYKSSTTFTSNFFKLLICLRSHAIHSEVVKYHLI